jgi:hypothetical protein
MENKLIPCPVCSHQVSCSAMKCPSCGEALSNKQKHIDDASFIAAKSFNDLPVFLLNLFLWLVAIAFWLSTAVYIPKILSILTVLCCIGYVSSVKKKTPAVPVKWIRVVVAATLSAVFFWSSFYR